MERTALNSDDADAHVPCRAPKKPNAIIDYTSCVNTFTAVYEEAEEGGYVAFVAELPGAIRKARRSMRRARTYARRFNSFLTQTAGAR